ncbi:peptidase inhibitor family I36 protein [Yersinia massiliensis]|uniref:peptidase inhibitor family I36 protein n=1 Tax=Yersinia massiliensis TaxID=419257 RepID=UPI001CFD4388|nr:peptidase inhibitor family I36 protein [Yersinia massiliensis]MCB5308697.1 peptidase inhibitor family I36 protein [Yersinia massiliensis]
MMKNKCLLLFFLMLMVLSSKVLAERNEICFYADSNYTGESICAAEGNEVKSIMKNWNDRISSISVPKGMTVLIYEGNNFSGRSMTLKSNIDFLSHPDLRYFNDIISSFKIKYSACFYEYDRFDGKAICLSDDEQTDLYNEKQHNISDSLNDRISSISVPSAMQVTLYKDDRYNGDRFVLTENFLLDALKELGMAFNISSITASQIDNFVCDRSCVVNNKMVIPIKSVFGQYWNDERIGAKQVLISLKLTGNDDYLIWLSDNGLIRVKDRIIYYIHDYISNAAYYEMSSDSNRLSILTRFNGGYFESQFIESFDYEMRYLSPIIGYLFNPSKDDIHFSILNFNLNENKSVIIDKIVMTVEKAKRRVERSIPGVASCWLMPILNIYNYIVQGKCNQVDRFVGNVSDFFDGSSDKILQISGTSKPLPKVDSNNENIFRNHLILSSTPYGTLTHIKAGLNKESLTLLATALACKVSMKEQLLPHIRTRREDSPACIDWTLDILTSFTLLFGGSLAGWNAENFGRVIERILHHQDTGYAVSDIETETRLVRSVGAFITANVDEDLIRLKTAFDFSQLSYANYLSHNNTESPVLPPQRSQELLLGRYELVLENFSYTETIPRIREAGQWVEHPELNFEVEIITGPPTETLFARQNVSPTVDEWHRIYRQPLPLMINSSEDSDDIEPSVLRARDSVIPASRIVSDVIQSWLRTSREDYIYVIVRLSGKIVSITLAVDINETDMGIGGALSDPAYVLHPLNVGTVRGAGTAAIKALAQFAAKKGKRALVSDVISQPSAIVKKKVGFRFIEEL